MVPNPMNKWMIWGYHYFWKHPYLCGIPTRHDNFCQFFMTPKFQEICRRTNLEDTCRNCLPGTLPETDSSYLKLIGWNTSFVLGWRIFRCELLILGRITPITCFTSNQRRLSQTLSELYHSSLSQKFLVR